MSRHTIIIPDDWAILTSEKVIVWIDEYEKNLYPKVPFLYEAANLHGLTTIKPWKTPEETVPMVFMEWNQMKTELQEGFKRRDLARTELPMKKGIGLFFEAIYWTNHQPVDVKTLSMEALKIKPINVRERLDYILLNPNKFHSFIQLSELFLEIEKLFKKQEVIMKVKQNRDGIK